MLRTICVSFLLVSGLMAQEFRGTITGLVTDSSKAAVPNANVQVKNLGTNEIVVSVTNGEGGYTAPLLSPGTYSISTTIAGFKAFTRSGVVLNVGQTVTVNLVLEVGAITEAVVVTGDAPLLETGSSDRGAVIDNLQVTEFPLNARNPFMLSMLTAGVDYNGNLIYQRPFDNGAIATWGMNGSLGTNSEYLLDGVTNDSQAGSNNIGLVPPVDAVQEFKIQTNSYDAQYGHTGGGIVNVTLKSGTNAFHGSVYEFARRNAWDANSFQNNAAGALKTGHRLDQYGVQAAGPIWIPKLWDGRNKTFFMSNYERYRERTPTPYYLSEPEPEMRTGNFSKLVNSLGQPITIYDPTTGSNVNGTWTRAPFPGNVIPAARINPMAQKILGYLPLPNTTTPGFNYSVNDLFESGGAMLFGDSFYNFAAKFDFYAGTKHRFFFRSANNDRHEFDSRNGIPFGTLGEDGGRTWRLNDAYALDWVATISPHLLFNLRGSFSRFVAKQPFPGNQGFDLMTLGFPASLVNQLPQAGWFGRYEFANYISLPNLSGYELGQIQNANYTNTVAILPTVTSIRGSHTIHAGMDIRWVQYLPQSPGEPFDLGADTGFTQKNYSLADGLSGDAFASWLLGTPSTGRVDYNVFPVFLYKYYAPYIQDDWKVTRRLTLNLGLRFDFNVQPNERYNRLNRGFDYTDTNPVDSLINRTQFPGFPTVTGGLLFAGVGGQPRDATNLDKNTPQPRIGGAFQISRKLVFRGGWGRYYFNPTNAAQQTYGYSQTTSLVSSLDGGETAIPNLINNPFPTGVQVPPGSSKGLESLLGSSLTVVNPNFKLPYVNQFSAGFQYEITNGVKLEASYVGNRSKDQQDTRAVNTYNLALRQQCDLMEGGTPSYCLQLLPNPFYGLQQFAGTSLFSSPTVTRASQNVPYPEFGSVTETMLNDASSWYNSMQITAQTRRWAGLNLLTTYTLSKNIYQAGYNDTQRLVLQEGVTSTDRTHRITIATVYQLPIGTGRHWLKTSHGVVSRLASGWETNWIVQWQSGLPWALPSNVVYLKPAEVSNINWSAPIVQGVSPCVEKWNSNGTITMQPFSVAAGCTSASFLETPQYAPRFTPNYDSKLRMNAKATADVSLNKTTRITERTSVQFRAEAFNIFNSFLFYGAQFNNNPESTSFGSMAPATTNTQSTNQPRYVQLALKFIW